MCVSHRALAGTLSLKLDISRAWTRWTDPGNANCRTTWDSRMTVCQERTYDEHMVDTKAWNTTVQILGTILYVMMNVLFCVLICERVLVIDGILSYDYTLIVLIKCFESNKWCWYLFDRSAFSVIFFRLFYLVLFYQLRIYLAIVELSLLCGKDKRHGKSASIRGSNFICFKSVRSVYFSNLYLNNKRFKEEFWFTVNHFQIKRINTFFMN